MNRLGFSEGSPVAGLAIMALGSILFIVSEALYPGERS